MVAFHCWLGLWLQLVPFDASAALTAAHPVPRIAAVAGPLAVDALLVICALLAAYQLVPALEAAAAPGGGGAWAAVRRYWRRRAARLLPAYLVVVLLSAVAAPADLAAPEARAARSLCHIDCPRGAWLNLTLLTHQRWQQSCGECRMRRRMGAAAGRAGCFASVLGLRSVPDPPCFRPSPVLPQASSCGR